jgi:hypothetical protein
LDKRKLYRTGILIIFLVALVGFACAIPGLPGEGQPTGEPGAPTAPPAEVTDPPEVKPTVPPEIEPTTQPEIEPTTPPEIEPTAPPVVDPTSPGGEVIPPDSGGSGTSDSLITGVFWLLVLVVIILGIALIYSLITGRNKDTESTAATPPPGQTPAYAETPEAGTGPQPVPVAAVVSVLDNISPQVAPLYDRFANLVQNLGPVTILPTQTRVDFQRRIIFASTQFSQEDMRVQMLLPARVDDPRMIRVEVYSEGKVAHTLVVRTVDDFDAKFTSWLQDAYELGGGS